MLECTSFNGWFYGTSYESVRNDCINIGVFNPTGVDSILARSDVDAMVFYVRTGDKTRLLRQLNRENNPDVNEIIRRFKTDTTDFSDLDFEYYELKNETQEDLDDNVQEILSLISPWRA
jgi:guanylate kinase